MPVPRNQAPSKSHGEIAHQFVHALRLGYVRLFNVKPSAFQATEHRPNRPMFVIVFDDRIWLLILSRTEVVCFPNATDEISEKKHKVLF